MIFLQNQMFNIRGLESSKDEVLSFFTSIPHKDPPNQSIFLCTIKDSDN